MITLVEMFLYVQQGNEEHGNCGVVSMVSAILFLQLNLAKWLGRKDFQKYVA